VRWVKINVGSDPSRISTMTTASGLSDSDAGGASGSEFRNAASMASMIELIAISLVQYFH
jgi:hypothetical protein